MCRFLFRTSRSALLLVAALLAGPSPALGDQLDTDMIGARALGRAGAVLVSEDSGAALRLNPGGMVRRSVLRVQVSAALRDVDSRFRAAGEPDAPTIINRAPLRSSPLFSVQGGVGKFVIGAAWIRTGDFAKNLTSPPLGQQLNADPDQLADQLQDVQRLFPHRYGGTDVSYRRSTWLAGVGIRARSWLGVGVSIGVSSLEIDEQRRMWAGFAGRDVVGDPRRDLVLTTTGCDRFVPTLNAGVLIAPPDLPIELAMSASYASAANLAGDAAVDQAWRESFPAPDAPNPLGEMTLHSSLIIRAGLRYLGERLSVEVGGAITLYGGTEPTWRVQGAAVRDESTVVASVDQVPSLLDYRDHGAIQASADVALVPGFLWLTGGYGFRMRGSSARQLTPGFADLGGHTLAIGAEGQWGNFAMAIGYAHTLSQAIDVTDSEVDIVNPFDAGTAASALGRYDSGVGAFGASLEVAWD